MREVYEFLDPDNDSDLHVYVIDRQHELTSSFRFLLHPIWTCLENFIESLQISAFVESSNCRKRMIDTKFELYIHKKLSCNMQTCYGEDVSNNLKNCSKICIKYIKNWSCHLHLRHIFHTTCLLLEVHIRGWICRHFERISRDIWKTRTVIVLYRNRSRQSNNVASVCYRLQLQSVYCFLEIVYGYPFTGLI